MYVIERFEGPEGDYSLSGGGKFDERAMEHLCSSTVSNLWG